MGIIALIFGIFELIIIFGKKKNIPHYLYSLKLMATTSVSLTFLVTTFFLVPTLKYPWYMLYMNSNLIFHLIVPILSIITFTIFEKSNEITVKDIIMSIIPVIIYSSFYTANVLSHVSESSVLIDYDFYGFLRGGFKTLPLVVFLILAITYAISFALVFFHQKEKKNRGKNIK